MAFRRINLFRISRSVSIIYRNVMSTTMVPQERQVKPKEYKTEQNFVYLEDPDTFGNLKSKYRSTSEILEDEGDIKEQQYLENLPLPSQKLTIKQYADLMKQFIKHKRLKEAIDVLEVRMLTQDRVKPDNYIYNILIGACAEVGYTKKAFKLFNDMKRRALKPTGDTYTCLFNACANSPWISDGLNNAQHLRALMLDRGIEPNLTNYNAMIKAFGRCGDLVTAFKIVDEMMSKKIKIRVHTFNHLLHACISDKATGLRHALVVWRKMLQMNEKPNIYSFNLMLKCVRECNLGNKQDIEELVTIIHGQMTCYLKKNQPEILQIESTEPKPTDININKPDTSVRLTNYNTQDSVETGICVSNAKDSEESTVCKTTLQFVDNVKSRQHAEMRLVPNLLSKVVNMQQVLSLQEVHTSLDKFAVLGGQDDFLKEMDSQSVKPDIKIFSQMLPLIEDTREAENKLLNSMKAYDIKADIDFYNILIKKRCLRLDYDGAFEVKDMIQEESKFRKKKYPYKKKLRLKPDIMTYGVLALACKNKESGEKLLSEMKDHKLKVNIEILGTLLRHGAMHKQFGYVFYIMNIVKEENIKVNNIFIKHLEVLRDKCVDIIEQAGEGKYKGSESFLKGCKHFLKYYRDWLKDLNIDEALKNEHPWTQFSENYPETIQRQDIQIIEPKKFLKRNKKFVRYTPRL